jgi:hypothetical protein
MRRKKAVVEPMSATLEAGGEIWMGDETMLRGNVVTIVFQGIVTAGVHAAY